MKKYLQIILPIVMAAAGCKSKQICAAHTSFFTADEAQLEEMFAVQKRQTKDSLFTNATTNDPKITASAEGGDSAAIALNPKLPKAQARSKETGLVEKQKKKKEDKKLDTFVLKDLMPKESKSPKEKKKKGSESPENEPAPPPGENPDINTEEKSDTE